MNKLIELSKQLHKDDISLDELMVLASMKNDREPRPIGTIATQLGVGFSRVSNYMDDLERRRMAVRKRSKKDRRVVLVHITQKGLDLLGTYNGYGE
jgi:DNA-binding MarR family transcriptional regulator